MSMSSLWRPFTFGRIELPHRHARAPMIRNRASEDGVPGAEGYTDHPTLARA